MVEPDMVERLFRPVFLNALPKRLRIRFDWLLEYAHYMNINEPFPSSLPELQTLMGAEHLSCSCSCASCCAESVFLRNLQYWADETGFGESFGQPPGADAYSAARVG
jgi:hypothetical protein